MPEQIAGEVIAQRAELAETRPDENLPQVISNHLITLPRRRLSPDELISLLREEPLTGLALLEHLQPEGLFNPPSEEDLLLQTIAHLAQPNPPVLFLTPLGSRAAELAEELWEAGVHTVGEDSVTGLVRLLQILVIHAVRICNQPRHDPQSFREFQDRYRFGWVLVSRELSPLECYCLEQIAGLGVRIMSLRHLPLSPSLYTRGKGDTLISSLRSWLASQAPYRNFDFDRGLASGYKRWLETNPGSFLLVRNQGGIDGIETRGVGATALGIVVDLPERDISLEITEYLEELLTRLVGKHFFGAAGEVSLTELRIDPEEVGRTIYQFLKQHFHLGKVGVSVVYDQHRLEQIQSLVYSFRLKRRDELRCRSELESPFFVSLKHSHITPDYLGIATASQPPMHGERYSEIMTRALLTPDPTYLPIKKGPLLDPHTREFAGVNKLFNLLTDGRIRRVQLHSVEEFPLPSSLRFDNAALKLPDGRGIVLVDRHYQGNVPGLGRMEQIVAGMVGRQVAGRLGFADDYLSSDNFLRGSGGWRRVVWLTSAVQEKARQRGIELDLPTEKRTVSLTSLAPRG